MTGTRVPVALVPSYDVVVGRGLLGQVGAEVVVAVPDARRALVVSQPPVAQRYATAVLASLDAAGLAASLQVVPDGEQAKSSASLSALWDACAAVPLGRRDVVVALGGGVVGDLAGFVAATWHRGVAVMQVPTTLLAQVDAAIGGKTAIDLEAGKNLVGAFHQPAGVLADVDTLATLSPRVRIEGLGEVVKYGLIRDPAILDLLEAHASAARDGDLDLLADLVVRSAVVKAAVVAADEREAGEREHLNLGHTFGHALETVTGYGALLHGEAIAVGTLVALHLGVASGRTPPALVTRIRDLLGALGLPTTAPPVDREAVWAAMDRDKKARGAVRFVVLDDLGAPTVLTPDRAAVDAAIDAVTASD